MKIDKENQLFLQMLALIAILFASYLGWEYFDNKIAQDAKVYAEESKKAAMVSAQALDEITGYMKEYRKLHDEFMAESRSLKEYADWKLKRERR